MQKLNKISQDFTLITSSIFPPQTRKLQVFCLQTSLKTFLMISENKSYLVCCLLGLEPSQLRVRHAFIPHVLSAVGKRKQSICFSPGFPTALQHLAVIAEGKFRTRLLIWAAARRPLLAAKGNTINNILFINQTFIILMCCIVYISANMFF